MTAHNSPRIEKIKQLARAEYPVMEIYRRVGGSIQSVHQTLYRLRKAGLAPPPISRSPLVAVNADVFAAFEVVAEERGCDPRELIREMLRAIADDDLFEAVSPARGGRKRS